MARPFCQIETPARGSAAGAFYEVKCAVRYLAKIFVLVAYLFMLFLIIVPVGEVFAEEYFSTERFDVEAKATRSHVISVKETIKVDFHEERHGIYRYIPVRLKYYNIRNIRVASNDYYETNFDFAGEDSDGTYGNEVIRIGDEYDYVYGRKTYIIKYDIVCNEDDSDEEDHLSLDLLPTGWQTAIDNATLSLTMPEKTDWDNARIYFGSYSDKNHFKDSSAGRIKSRVTDGGKTLVITGKDLKKGEGVTISSKLREGYWTNEAGFGRLKNWIFLIPIAVLMIMVILWLTCGRDPLVVKPIEFYPPDGLTPAEVGYIVDGRLDDKDISSMLMYFASKGYLEIREKEGRKNGGYELIKGKDPEDNEPEFAKSLYEGLTSGGTIINGEQETVDLDDLPESFADKVAVAKEQIKSEYDYGERKMFTDRSKAARNVGGFFTVVTVPLCMALFALLSYYIVGAITALIPLVLALVGVLLVLGAYDRRHSTGRVGKTLKFTAGVVLIIIAFGYSALFMLTHGASPLLVMVLGISLFVSIICEVLMWARTKENAKLLGRVLGFREFIEKAEFDRIKKLSEENPEFYYDIMPYAMVMGMSAAWAKKFESFDLPKPSWYSGTGDISVWDAIWYQRMVMSLADSVSSQSIVIDSTDSGGFFSGGFGGGGFTGGGFGGGGGGSW